MIFTLTTSLRLVVLVMVLVIPFYPVTANAYVSNGTGGIFQPASSVVLDSTQQIFNFTSIFIPSGVTVSFSGLASAQPVELLATGNIDIAGTIDMGAYNLWIETPGSISLSGSLNGSGGVLSLVANSMNLTGSVNNPTGSTSLTSTSGSGAISGGSGAGVIISGGGGAILSPVPEPNVWTTLLLGLGVLFAATRVRNRNTCCA